MPDSPIKRGQQQGEHLAKHTETPASGLVDEITARSLAEERNLPEVEIDAALHGETVALANAVLDWIDREEKVLVAHHGLLEGRKRYRPVKMLRNWARKHETGRRRNSGTGGSRQGPGRTDT